MVVIKLKYIPPVICSYTLVMLLFTVLVHFVTAPVEEIGRLPPLSETATYLPGRYIFITALILPSIAMILGAVAVFNSNRVLLSKITHGAQRLICCYGCCRITGVNITSLISAIVAGISLFGLAVVPLRNPDDNNLSLTLSARVHLMFTFIFFVSIIVHMILSTVTSIVFDRQLNQAVQNNDLSISSRRLSGWVIFKIVIICLVFIVWPLLPLIGLIVTVSSCSGASISAGTCGFLQFVTAVGAVDQYAFVLCIILFMLTYMHELRNSKMTLDDSDEYDEQLAALRLGEHVFNEIETDNGRLNDDEFEFNVNEQ
ncbi:hypothetical protein AKO1_000656 [Acrasis kona]|uniref:CWH43-like N-terminal domain-containing protein n=1 Tax=Acrasis kona TaxID=1008807 RepID=A0AAW2YM63_9EUKA